MFLLFLLLLQGDSGEKGEKVSQNQPVVWGNFHALMQGCEKKSYPHVKKQTVMLFSVSHTSMHRCWALCSPSFSQSLTRKQRNSLKFRLTFELLYGFHLIFLLFIHAIS